MLTIITNKKEIAACQKRLEKLILKTCTLRVRTKIGFRGESREVAVNYSPSYDFWFLFKKSGNRFWNAFNLGRPFENKSNSIAVEINPPFQGIDRRSGGIFGKDEKGRLYLLHRGKLGGGKEGVGKNLFFENYTGAIELALDGIIESEVAMVTPLHSKKFNQNIRSFIEECVRIRGTKNITQRPPGVPDFLKKGEREGTRKGSNYSGIEIDLFHAQVVNALLRMLLKRNLNAKRDRLRDAVVIEKGRVSTVFEVKMSASLSDICKAVGQLLLYTKGERVKRVLLLPSTINKDLSSELSRLGITVRHFVWDPVKEKTTKFNL